MSTLDQISIGLICVSFGFCLKVIQESLTRFGILNERGIQFEMARHRCEQEEAGVREEIIALSRVQAETERELASASDVEKTLVRKVIVYRSET